MSHILLFVLALGLLLLGHLLRATRWGLLLAHNNRNELRPRFIALAFGYVINAVLPLRAGEFVRALVFASQSKTKLTRAFASIILERTYDLVAIAVIVLICSLIDIIPLGLGCRVAAFTACFSILIFLLMASLHTSAFARKSLWCIANIFNERIRFGILDTAMCLTEIIASIKRVWIRFLLQSIAMWAVYIASYLALCLAIQLNLATILDFFYGSLFRPTIFEVIQKDRVGGLLVAVYALIPCLVVILYSKLSQLSPIHMGASLAWLIDPQLQLEKRTYERFGEISGYDAFLCRHFSGESGIALDFETYAIQNATIIRRLEGGSDALTAVVEVDSQLRYRKYALNGAAQKLDAQYQWLERYKTEISLVHPLNPQRLPGRFLYDMPYSLSSRDFYDFIHSNSQESSWQILSQVLESIHQFHQSHPTGNAGDAVVREYIAHKVSHNLKTIKESFPQIFENETLTVNNVKISLTHFDQFAREDFLLPRISMRETTIIHGDLTIENIIFDPEYPNGWFLIDPNIGNIFESPLLDYAKIFQSLHLGYEALNRNNPCGYSNSGIEFFMPRSIFYESLFNHASEWLRDKFSADTCREIRLHEIIHYFRLVPYKIRKSPHRGILFLGCLGLLIDKYFHDFEKC